MRRYELSDKLKKALKKLMKKDRTKFESVMNKIKEIINCDNIDHYKNLRSPLQHLKRVHIEKSHVLIFQFIKSDDLVRFMEFDHHDTIYS